MDLDERKAVLREQLLRAVETYIEKLPRLADPEDPYTGPWVKQTSVGRLEGLSVVITIEVQPTGGG